jgi:predicted nucleic acid-binding protein
VVFGARPIVYRQIDGLHPGEIAAVSLATELKADILLVDDLRGREAAMARKILTVRTAALLFDAANAGVLGDLADAFEKLKATNFRVPHKVLDELLARHRGGKASR